MTFGEPRSFSGQLRYSVGAALLFLKRLKCVHDHGDMILRVFEEAEWRSKTPRMLTELGNCEVYCRGNLHIEAYWRTRLDGVTVSTQRKLGIGPPLFGGLRDDLTFNDIRGRELSTGSLVKYRMVIGDDAVLIGVGEKIDNEEWVLFGRCSVERLQALDFHCTADNAMQHPWSVLGIFEGIIADRELMVFSDGDSTFLCKSNDDVIQSRPQIVYKVPEDDPEMRFVEIPRSQYDRVPTGVFVVPEHGLVGTSLLINDLNLCFEGLKMLVRSGDLCKGVGQVQVERHIRLKVC